MAAGGGTFTVQNKVLPGAYINFVSKARALGTLGERGIVALPWISSWGKENEVVTIDSADFQTDALNIFGYSYTDNELQPIRELFKGAKALKLYRISSGDKAKAELNSLTVTALYGGKRGNDIKIIIENDIDNSDTFIVKTVIGNENIQVDEQKAKKIEDLKANNFVSFSGTGTLTASAGTSLSNGTDSEITGNDYSIFLDKIEAEDFTVLLYAGQESTIKGLITSFVKRLRDDEGYKITAVLHDYPKADFEGIISVKNEVTTTGVNKENLVYWIAGMTAGAEVNESLTNKLYDGEYQINTTYKKSELEEAIKNGEFMFYGDKDGSRVLKDINTFVSITPNKNSDFSNNQVIRVLDAIANDTARIFNQSYLGKVQNNDIGRDMFKSELINYHITLQGIQAITNFESDDIVISKGAEKGDVVVNEYVEPVAAMEKLYMTCIVE